MDSHVIVTNTDMLSHVHASSLVSNYSEILLCLIKKIHNHSYQVRESQFIISVIHSML